MTAKEHNKMIGIFLMSHGALQGVGMIMLCVIYGIIGGAMVAAGPQDETKIVGLAFIGLVFVIGIIALIFILPQIIGGYKMLKEKPNARTWGIIASIISCFSFPLGTAAGVYGMWFLFGDLGKQFYLGGSQPQYAFSNPSQPPPNSWQ
jgi:hypothetical protein